MSSKELSPNIRITGALVADTNPTRVDKVEFSSGAKNLTKLVQEANTWNKALNDQPISGREARKETFRSIGIFIEDATKPATVSQPERVVTEATKKGSSSEHAEFEDVETVVLPSPPLTDAQIKQTVNKHYKGNVKGMCNVLYTELYQDFPIPGIGKLLALGHAAWIVNTYKRQEAENMRAFPKTPYRMKLGRVTLLK